MLRPANWQATERFEDPPCPDQGPDPARNGRLARIPFAFGLQPWDQKKRLDSYLSDTVTNEKAILSVYLRAGLSGAESPVNVPSLWDLIATVYSNMHPDFKGMGAVEIHEDNRLTKGAKIRISYLRFMVNLNRLKSNKKVSSFWDDIDHDLHALRRHPLAYQVAYTQIIFDTDRRIWDGHHTVDQVPADQQAPPSEEGVNARIQSAMANPEPNQVQI
ncbi:hypothetical protein H4Q26_009677 [Puccinia striiformis f. sp. tritici PST-130]|nr:hypothetical protein H4Q26_009677 [Puccinia striiformis f. sp. tritici PST-130]